MKITGQVKLAVVIMMDAMNGTVKCISDANMCSVAFYYLLLTQP